MRGTGFSESDPAVTGMKNKESLVAISLLCRKILKLLSGFLLLHKDQQKGEDRRISAILNLLYRMDCNILTVLMISNWSQKRNNTVFLKLPMGVLLRTVLTDSIHAMFFMTISDAEVEKELELLRMGYANSLLDRREVYKDKVRRVSPDMDDSLLDMLYYGQLEDNYLDFYDYNEEAGFWIKKLDKHGRKERGLEKLPTSTMEGKFNALQGDPIFGEVAKRAYQYYKYFSQYEHFSEEGQGDILVPFGDDNIHFPSAMGVIEESVETLMKNFKS